jgi:hypothetical protein
VTCIVDYADIRDDADLVRADGRNAVLCFARCLIAFEHFSEPGFAAFCTRLRLGGGGANSQNGYGCDGCENLLHGRSPWYRRMSHAPA